MSRASSSTQMPPLGAIAAVLWVLQAQGRGQAVRSEPASNLDSKRRHCRAPRT